MSALLVAIKRYATARCIRRSALVARQFSGTIHLCSDCAHGFRLGKLQAPLQRRSFSQGVTGSKDSGLGRRALSVLAGAALVVGFGFAYSYYMDSRAGIHRWLIMPLMRAIDPELAHKITIKSLSLGLAPKDMQKDDPALKAIFLGREFANPVALAAGMDKNGEAIDALFDLGFAYVEIGTITPRPQPGNPKPRVFRLPEDASVINRYGFNSQGINVIAKRLLKRSRKHGQASNKLEDLPQSLRPHKYLAINIGKNKDSRTEQDFIEGVRSLGPYADFLVVNVSSPNTPGLRDWQTEERLLSLLQNVRQEAELSCENKPPILVKISPDLDERAVEGVASAIKASNIDAVIVSNTTVSRDPDIKSKQYVDEIGGLSGPPLKPKALKILRKIHQLLPATPIIACGGISSGKDAVEYARAGATLVQAYTAMAYQGVGFPRKLKDEILQELNGKSWMEIVNEENKKSDR